MVFIVSSFSIHLLSLLRRFLWFLALILIFGCNDDSRYFVNAQQNVINVNEHFGKSEDPQFDNEIMLTKELKFLWRNPSGLNNKGDMSEYFTGRLLHTTTGNDPMSAPTWLGFGIIDGASVTSPSASTTTTTTTTASATYYNMEGSIAIIGEERLNAVRKFTLGGNNHRIGNDEVQSLPTVQQTLGYMSKIDQIQYYNDDTSDNKTTVIETVLDFQKFFIEDNLDENPEPIILMKGTNVFMYAVGPSRDNPGFGVHSKAGYFLLDLAEAAAASTKTQGQVDQDKPSDSTVDQVNNDKGNLNQGTNNDDIGNDESTTNDMDVDDVYSVYDIINATALHTDFMQDADHHQVILQDGLIFQWRDIMNDEEDSAAKSANIFAGRLIHRVERLDDSAIPTNPSWIGFGWLDTVNNPNPPIDGWTLMMQGSESIIGSINKRSEDGNNDGWVYKYRLGAQHSTGEMVYRYPDQQQTLRLGTVVQLPDASGYWTTVLSFEKLVVEPNPDETPLRTSGENVFLWAIGPSYEASGGADDDSNNAAGGVPPSNLGTHTSRGGFVLDFEAVRRQNSEIVVPPPPYNDDIRNDSPSPSSIRTELESEENAIPAPIVNGVCYSDKFGMQGRGEGRGQWIQLTPNLEMHWMLKVDNEGLETPFGEGTGIPSISIIVIYDGLAWIGIGFSKGLSEKVHKRGSISVIGLPNTANSPQLKYNISDPDNIFAVSDQTLIESHVSQENGQTILRFEKALVDGFDEATISANGFNTISYAIGHDNELGFHRHRGVFRINFSECFEPRPTRPPTARPTEFSYFDEGEYSYDEEVTPVTTEGVHRVDTHGAGALIAHAIFAILAWALCMPFAVTSAWFRTMVPTSWIYFHVFGNVATFFFTFIAIMLGVGAVGLRPSSHHFSKGHHIVGMILFTLVTIQVVNGFFRPPVVKPLNVDHNGQAIPTNQEAAPGARARQIWHTFHRALGVIMLLLALNQIHTGIRLLMMDFEINNALMVIFWVYVLFFATFCVVFKLWLLLEHPTSRLMEQQRQRNGGSSDGHLGGSLAGRQMEDDDEDLSFSDDVDLSDDDDYGIGGGGDGVLRSASDRSRGEPTVPQIT